MKEYSPHIPFSEFPRAPDFEMGVRIILGRGIFDRRSFEHLMRHTPSRDVAVDVGAHVGSWTIGFSKLFGSVVSFEPQPTNRDYLEKNILRAHAENVVIRPEAVINDLSQIFSISATGSTRNSAMTHLKPLDLSLIHI